MKKCISIFLAALPIILMIALIPLVANDYLLALLYIIIIAAAFAIKREKNDFTILIFGFCIMIVSEYFFIKTGVETFDRNTLFGIMPIWLPFLWAYGFVAIKRAGEVLR